MDHLLKNVIQGGLGKVERASASRSRTSNPLLFGVVDQTEVRRASTLGLGGRRRDNEVRLDRVPLCERPRAPRRMDLPHQLPPFGRHGTALLVAPVPVDDPFDHGPRSFHGDEDGVPHVSGRLRGDPVGEHGRIGILRHPPDDQKHRRVRVSPLAPLSHPILILRPPGGGRWRFKPMARGKSLCQHGLFALTNVGIVREADHFRAVTMTHSQGIRIPLWVRHSLRFSRVRARILPWTSGSSSRIECPRGVPSTNVSM